MFKEYTEYDATGLAGLVAGRQVSPAELLEAAIDRAERLNPQLNAIITPMYDEARQRLEQAFTGPFMGVPFLLKDLLAAYKGVPLSNGSEAFRHYIPDHDSTLVTRFKAAGLNIFGKTNTPELGLMGVTEPRAFGPARNPWNTERTPGGSSGGSAAAVAAGIVPMAAAGDGGGSIRIPSACCGLFGFKPSRGRGPAGPDFGEVWDGAAVQHVISRSVRDSAAVLDVTDGEEPGSPYPFAGGQGAYLSAALQSPSPLKIAFDTRSPLGGPVDADCVAAVEDAAALLQSLGHSVEQACPAIDGRRVAHCYLTMYMGHVAAELATMARATGVSVRRLRVEETTRALGMLGRALSAETFVTCKLAWNGFAREMARFHQQYDIYLTPVTAAAPLPVGYFEPGSGEKLFLQLANRLNLGKWLLKSGVVDKMAMQGLEKLPFTQLANLTGQPAMSVPLYWNGDSLPIGVQFIAPMGAERRLLSLAGQLEQARAWAHRWPPVA
ncbi:amidase [Exilibacterium tricleocarpae]|uniref:Amidase n=1 Tax=Exilibacterium tricleocarpae TaxID=2591008 RepID=A0A545SY43_9GAMM|nr:amidase family protein [Exilibacterium tricleocarpae]TQV69880.1 amidase [Exilibacterium tricleocarpae]